MNFKSLLLLAVMLFSAPIFTGCASMGAASMEPLLAASGFRVHTPANAAQREIYASLPPYKMQRGTHAGKIFYAYKDEKQGIAYIGGEAEYQKYQDLAVRQSIARDHYEAAQMNEAMSNRWYGAYPPIYHGRL